MAEEPEKTDETEETFILETQTDEAELQDSHEPVSYIDADGNDMEAVTDYTVVDESTAQWSDGWYVVTEDVTVSSRIKVTGNVNLILCTGKTLTADDGITVNELDSLTIWSQVLYEYQMNPQNLGDLYIKSKGDSDNAFLGGESGHSAGMITVNGGRLNIGGNATNKDNAAGIGGGNGGNIIINGGQVVAGNGDAYSGIGAGKGGSGGTVTLNYDNQNPTTVLTAAEYKCKLVLEKDFRCDGKKISAGTYNNPSDFDYETLEPYKYTITLVQPEHGTIYSDLTEAVPYQPVHLSYEAEPGYSFLGFDIYVEEYDMSRHDADFDMPPSNVTVRGHFGATVPYVDAKGAAQTPVSEYEVLTDLTDTYSNGWVVLKNNVTLNTVSISGNVNLILCDGATLNVSRGIRVNDSASLTIWAQSTGESAGKIVSDSSSQSSYLDYPAIGGPYDSYNGTITINGGNITAKGAPGKAGIGGGASGGAGTIVINGGIVNTAGGSDAAGIGVGTGSGGSITINGGTVNASGGANAAGIGGEGVAVTLD